LRLDSILLKQNHSYFEILFKGPGILTVHMLAYFCYCYIREIIISYLYDLTSADLSCKGKIQTSNTLSHVSFVLLQVLKHV